MEVTLEKIELVKDRTGISYKEAKEALEAADGSVVDAIINIEENIDTETTKSVQDQGAAIIDNVKNLVKKGNVSKIVVKKNDGEVLLNLPVNAGIIGAVLAPWGVLAGILSTFMFKCVVEVVKDDGTIIDVSDRANDAMGKAAEKGSSLKDAAVQKGSEVVEKVRSNEKVESVLDKAEDAFESTKEAVVNRFKKDDDVDSFMEEAGDVAEEAESAMNEAKETVESTVENMSAAAEEAVNKAEDFNA